MQHRYCAERTNIAPASKLDEQKQTCKHHIFALTAGARCSTSPKLCMVIKDVVPTIKDVNHFSIQRIVFPTGCTEKFGVNDRRAVSQQ